MGAGQRESRDQETQAMEKRPQGPNVKKLAIRFMSKEAIPEGGGLADGMKFLSDPERVTEAARRGVEQAFTAIDAIKAAPDNVYGEDDETIAAAILEALKPKSGKSSGGAHTR